MMQRQGQVEADGSRRDPTHPAPPHPARAPDRASVFGRIAEFFREVRSELRQVAWPTRQEVANSATVVFLILVVLADLLAQRRLLPLVIFLFKS